jgi:hypothetical protein
VELVAAVMVGVGHLLQLLEQQILAAVVEVVAAVLTAAQAALVLSSSSAINKVNDELSWSNNY